MNELEAWKPVLGFEGHFEVSSHGRVRSVDREITRPSGSVHISGRMMKVYVGPQGYRLVRITKGKASKLARVPVLVCEAFHGARPAGKFAAHRNGQRIDDRAENLRWLTRKENEREKALHGTKPIGSAVHSAVLTEPDVHSIRKLRRAGQSYSQIARSLSVTYEMVRCVCVGRTWKHVQEAHHGV